jgi:hypothetical protein
MPRRRLRCNGYTPLLVRFWLSFKKRRGNNACWKWTGSTNDEGYPHIRYKGRIVKASHVAWFLETGEWPPKGMEVCHHCDERDCVRFRHFFLGTHLDNMRDRQRKGRTRNQHTGRAA